MAVTRLLTGRQLASVVFADGDKFHFWRDDAGAGIGQLSQAP